jgi:hypothetical protein
MAKSRWEIENRGFNDGKNRYGMKHLCHHEPNSILIVWLLTQLPHFGAAENYFGVVYGWFDGTGNGLALCFQCCIFGTLALGVEKVV